MKYPVTVETLEGIIKEQGTEAPESLHGLLEAIAANLNIAYLDGMKEGIKNAKRRNQQDITG